MRVKKVKAFYGSFSLNLLMYAVNTEPVSGSIVSDFFKHCLLYEYSVSVIGAFTSLKLILIWL